MESRKLFAMFFLLTGIYQSLGRRKLDSNHHKAFDTSQYNSEYFRNWPRSLPRSYNGDGLRKLRARPKDSIRVKSLSSSRRGKVGALRSKRVSNGKARTLPVRKGKRSYLSDLESDELFPLRKRQLQSEKKTKSLTKDAPFKGSEQVRKAPKESRRKLQRRRRRRRGRRNRGGGGAVNQQGNWNQPSSQQSAPSSNTQRRQPLHRFRRFQHNAIQWRNQLAYIREHRARVARAARLWHRLQIRTRRANARQRSLTRFGLRINNVRRTLNFRNNRESVYASSLRTEESLYRGNKRIFDPLSEKQRDFDKKADNDLFNYYTSRSTSTPSSWVAPDFQDIFY